MTAPDSIGPYHVLAKLGEGGMGQVYGFEDSGSTHGLVMELVEGTTLAERIARGPIPPADAIAIARQVAHALEAAHELGLVHRDLVRGAQAPRASKKVVKEAA